MGGKCEHRLVACWPCLGDGGSLAWSWCCMWDYIFELVKFYSLDYQSMRKGDIKEWRADSSVCSLPCGVSHIGKLSGMSGGDVEG
jgi:hypothetical protein